MEELVMRGNMDSMMLNEKGACNRKDVNVSGKRSNVEYMRQSLKEIDRVKGRL